MRHFPGNLVSSSNGIKVVGITGSVVSDIEDLVVATVIPGLGKDMDTVQVKQIFWPKLYIENAPKCHLLLRFNSG